MDVIRGLICFAPFLLLALAIAWVLHGEIPRSADERWEQECARWDAFQQSLNEGAYHLGYAWGEADGQRMAEGLQPKGLPAMSSSIMAYGYRAALRACGSSLIREAAIDPEPVGERV